MEAGFRVIRVNLPGFGETIKPQDFGINFQNMSHFLANFLSAINIDTIDMAVGHSFGCALLAMLSMLRPNLIKAFTFLSSLGLRPHSAIRPYTGN